MNLLSVENLKVEFNTEDGVVQPLDGVSFRIDRGRVLGLVGETGSGKSVTAQAIMGLLPFLGGRAKGRIIFDGRDLVPLSEEEWQRIRGNRISMISQNPMTALDPVYRVGDQIVEGMRLHLGISAKEAKAKAIDLMTSLQIPNAASVYYQYPHQLSGGLKQRIVIAMGLCADPLLLVADEPTTALDVTVQAQIVNLFKKTVRERDIGLLLITHDLGVIAQICDEVAVMYAGTVVEWGGVEDVFANPCHPYTRSLLKCVPTMRMQAGDLKAIPGNVPSVRTFPRGCRYHPRCSEVTDQCQEQKPSTIQLDSGISVACMKFIGTRRGAA